MKRQHRRIGILINLFLDFLYGFVLFARFHWLGPSESVGHKTQPKNRIVKSCECRWKRRQNSKTELISGGQIEVLIEVNWKVDTRSTCVDCRPVSPMSKWQHKSITWNNTNLCSSFVLHRRRRCRAQSSCDRSCVCNAPRCIAFARFHHILFFNLFVFSCRSTGARIEAVVAVYL